MMPENGHGSSAQKRFNDDGNSGAAEHKVWKRWARAALVVKKLNASRGSGALDLHSSGWSGRIGTGVDRNQGHVHGWRGGTRLPRTRSKIPRQGGSRPYGRGHGGGLWIEDHEKMRRRRLSLEDRDLCLPVFRHKE